MRWYSAALKAPRAIIVDRRAIVAYEAIASSVIIIGSERVRRRADFFMTYRGLKLTDRAALRR